MRALTNISPTFPPLAAFYQRDAVIALVCSPHDAAATAGAAPTSRHPAARSRVLQGGSRTVGRRAEQATEAPRRRRRRGLGGPPPR